MNNFEIEIERVLPDLFEPADGVAAFVHGLVGQPGSFIPEGQRNSTLMQWAGRLQRLGLPTSAIAAALHAMNEERCVPPLSSQEVNGIARSVSRYQPDAAAFGVGVPAESLPFTTAARIAMDTPLAPRWLVPGFVAQGVVSEFDGKLKASGKTTFIAALVKAVLTGTPFLGRPTRRTSVVWLTEERSPTFLEALKRAQLTGHDDLHVLFWHDVRPVAWPATVTGAVTHAQKVGADLLVVDTIGQWAGLRGDAENNNGDQMAAAEPLQLASSQGLAVVVARHERKGGGEVGESGRGGSAFSGAVDIVVSIRRPEGQTRPTVRVLHSLSRFTETPETLTVELTADGYVALGTGGAVAVMEAEGQILARLPGDEDAAMDLKTIIGDDVKRTTAQEALKRLTDAGVVGRRGTGSKTDPHRWFKNKNAAGTQIT